MITRKRKALTVLLLVGLLAGCQTLQLATEVGVLESKYFNVAQFVTYSGIICPDIKTHLNNYKVMRMDKKAAVAPNEIQKFVTANCFFTEKARLRLVKLEMIDHGTESGDYELWSVYLGPQDEAEGTVNYILILVPPAKKQTDFEI